MQDFFNYMDIPANFYFSCKKGLTDFIRKPFASKWLGDQDSNLS